MKKISFKNIKESLSRKELRSIMGGSGSGTCQGKGYECNGVYGSCCAGLTCIDCNVHRHYYCW